MKNRIYIISLFLSLSYCGFAQKITQQTLTIDAIEEIKINTNKIFQLNIYNTDDAVVKIETKMEGEYYRDINIITATKNKQLQLTCEFAEGFELPNDKLSAHKVFAISMNVYIPKQLKVQLEGDETQVYVKGKYKRFWGVLISGNYMLDDFYGEAKIHSKKGDIHYKRSKLPIFEVKTTHEIIYYEKGKKVELKTDNGKITYSSNKA